MAYTLSIPLLLGAGNAGKTLEAQLFTPGPPVADYGSPVNTGFVERGTKGTYLWTGSIPDGFQGGVEFRDAATATVLSLVAINPQEAEYTDVKVSSRTGMATVLSELPPGAPPATPTVEQAVMLLYMALRNRLDTTASELTFHNDAGDVIARAALSDDGITFRREEIAAP
jgi:hypothetical protein